MLDTNVTHREIAALDERRERLKGLPSSVLCMTMTDAVDHAGGNGRPLIERYGTVGEMLETDVRDVLSIHYIGKKKLDRLYTALEARIPKDAGRSGGERSPATNAEIPGNPAEDGLWERISREEDAPVIRNEISRLVQIERSLCDVPAPDGSSRSSATVMKQALAIYARMGSMGFCDNLEGALENHATAMLDLASNGG